MRFRLIRLAALLLLLYGCNGDGDGDGGVVLGDCALFGVNCDEWLERLLGILG